MTQMPKIPHSVIARLLAGSPDSPGSVGAQHPDANLLSAFSENSLQKRERAQLMEHLAQCPQCRDVLALQVAAATQMGEEASPAKSPQRQREWLARTELRWAAVAASLAVVAGIFLLRQPDRVYQDRTPSSPATSALQPQGTKRQDSASNESKVEIAKKENRPVAVPENQISRNTSARSRAAKTTQTPMPATSVATANANFDHFGREIWKDKVAAPPAPTPPAIASNAPLAGSAPAASESGAAPKVSSETVEVEGRPEPQSVRHAAEAGDRKAEKQSANALTITAADSVSSEETTQPRQSGSIGGFAGYSTMAKSSASSPPARLPRPGERWRVEQGVLQRSENAGQTWSTLDIRTGAVPGLAIAFRGDEVWAGDSQGGLSHSSDNAQHWQRVLYGGTENIEGATIVSVSIPSAGHVVIKNSAGHTWFTRDDGKTWRMK
jgi:hypothetical protein